MLNVNPVVLTVDLGTQSVRAMLVNKDGHILSKRSTGMKSRIILPFPAGRNRSPMFIGTLCVT